MAEYKRNIDPAKSPLFIYFKIFWSMLTLAAVGFFLIIFCGAMFNVMIGLINNDSEALSFALLALLFSIPLFFIALLAVLVIFWQPKDKYSTVTDSTQQKEIIVAEKEMSASSYTTYRTAAISLYVSPKHINSVAYWIFDTEHKMYRIDRNMYKNIRVGDKVDLEFHSQGGANVVTKLTGKDDNQPIAEPDLVAEEKVVLRRAYHRGIDRQLIVLGVFFAGIVATVFILGSLAIFWKALVQ